MCCGCEPNALASEMLPLPGGHGMLCLGHSRAAEHQDSLEPVSDGNEGINKRPCTAVSDPSKVSP